MPRRPSWRSSSRRTSRCPTNQSRVASMTIPHRRLRSPLNSRGHFHGLSRPARTGRIGRIAVSGHRLTKVNRPLANRRQLQIGPTLAAPIAREPRQPVVGDRLVVDPVEQLRKRPRFATRLGIAMSASRAITCTWRWLTRPRSEIYSRFPKNTSAAELSRPRRRSSIGGRDRFLPVSGDHEIGRLTIAGESMSSRKNAMLDRGE
jgi:hypothetical protein